MNIRNLIVAGIIMTVSSATLSADEPVAYVNPFIGTTNFGTTNPGHTIQCNGFRQKRI